MVAITMAMRPAEQPGLIVLNPAVKHQTITGWEASAQAGQERADYRLYRDQLLDQAVNDLGITRLRLPILSGAENTRDNYQLMRRGQVKDWRCVRYATVNDNNDPFRINWKGFQFSQIDSVVEEVVLPMKQKLAARGEKLFLNLLYVAFTKQICRGLHYDHENPAEYAEFMLAATLHLRDKYQLVPDSWEVMLEPDNTSFWRGKQLGDAIAATAKRLEQAGFKPRFIAPSTTRSYNAAPYFDEMMASNPGIKPYLRELSYHRYSAVTAADLAGIANRAKRFGIQASMLEHIGSGFPALQQDLKQADVTAWEQFALAFGAIDDGSQYYLVERSAGAPRVLLASRTRFLRQYFHFIRPGAVRIDATTTSGTADPVAFINRDGGWVVVVAATAASGFSVQGLPAGKYGIKYTTATAYNVDAPPVTIRQGQLVSTRIPARGVLTIYHR